MVKLPDDANDGNSPRSGSQLFLIRLWARDGPGAALVAAEAESGARLRRLLIAEVGHVWARMRPEPIDRAIKNIDTRFWRTRVRQLAADELEHRKKCLLTRDIFEAMLGE